MDVPRAIKAAALKDAVTKFDMVKKFGETPFAKKIHRAQTRAKLTDFDRFKVMVLRKKVIYYFIVFFVCFFRLKIKI